MRTATAEPVRWDETAGAFLISGYDEAATVLRDSGPPGSGPPGSGPLGWSSDPRRSPLAPPEVRAIPPGALLFMDPPEHTRLRRLLGPTFSPRSIERLRPRVGAIVDAVLDGLAEDGPGADVLRDVGHPVPLAVIAELLDVGVEGAVLFQEQTPDLVRMLEVDAGRDDLLASTAASTELMLFLTPIIAERRHRPGADFISALLATPTGPDGIELEEVLATCILLLAAGHETTANLITNGTLALLRNPDQRAGLSASPQRAVEELLRLEGAVKLAGRTALTEHTLAGRQIDAGQAVLVLIQQANRDPRRFTDPLRLDLGRTPAGHLAFGAGAHFCLGAALARLEITETLTRLFARFPGLALTGAPIRRRESTTFHGLRELPVRLSDPG